MNDISDLLKKGVQEKDFPGAQYAIIYKDGRINSDFIGYRQIQPERTLNDGTEIYDCASLTKVVCTTTLIMQLIEEGVLKLETKVHHVLANFKHKSITLYHLLTHTSGLPADIPQARHLKNKDMVLEKIFDFDLINPVGETVVYSDIGFILLGLIIEKVTGQTLDTNAKLRIFDPLGMNDSSFKPDSLRCAPTEYRHDDVYQGLLQGQVHDEKSFALGGVAGHAGLFSTVNDLSKFVKIFLNNDGVILKSETLDLLFKCQISCQIKEGLVRHRAIGWNKPTLGGTAGDYASFDDTILHTGFTGCNIWIERQKGMAFVMLSNAVHPDRNRNNILKYRNQIANMILSPRRKG